VQRRCKRAQATSPRSDPGRPRIELDSPFENFAPPARVELAANALGKPDRDPSLVDLAENKPDREDEIAPNCTPRGPAVHSRSIQRPPDDPLEHALRLAAEAGRFDVVSQLARELEARRLAGGNVVALKDMRARRER
jgi:hypothetical protein